MNSENDVFSLDSAHKPLFRDSNGLPFFGARKVFKIASFDAMIFHIK